MIIGIDMMGGDYAPQEAVNGVTLFLNELSSNVTLCLIGDEAQLKPAFQHRIASLRFVHTTEVIDMSDSPTRSLRDKPNASISIGFRMLAAGEIDAFISAGSTGAMMVGALYSLKAIEGVLRPTISTVIPKITGGYGLLLDVGLLADAKPENLLQCAILGSLYAQNILDVDAPTVGLVNIGEEETKGNILAQNTYSLLKNSPHINFIGNVEGREILAAKADVMVCDGFTGNVILKLGESIYDIAKCRNLHEDEYFKRFDFENYGGTPVLGVDKPVIIGHGISTGKAFKNMIHLAIKMIESRLLEKIRDRFITAE